MASDTKTLQKVTRRVIIEINQFRKAKGLFVFCFSCRSGWLGVCVLLNGFAGVEFKQFMLDFVHMQMEYAQKVCAFPLWSLVFFSSNARRCAQVQAAWESILPELESM